MKKIIMASLCFFVLNVASSAIAWAAGDKVYVIFGEGSASEVESGYIRVVGNSNSKVEWNYCSDCPDWVANWRFYEYYSDAEKERARRDSEHTSLGEAASAAAIGGLIYLLLNND